MLTTQTKQRGKSLKDYGCMQFDVYGLPLYVCCHCTCLYVALGYTNNVFGLVGVAKAAGGMGLYNIAQNSSFARTPQYIPRCLLFNHQSNPIFMTLPISVQQVTVGDRQYYHTIMAVPHL